MIELRTILAFASLLGGGALLLIGSLRLSRRGLVREGREDRGLVLVYGSLFVLAGLVLLFRVPQIHRQSPPAATKPLSVDSPFHEAVPLDSSARPVEHVTSNRPDSISESLVRSGTASPASGRADTDRTTSLSAKHQVRSARKQDAQSPASPGRQLAIEDRMYLAISRAFDSVEDWFMKHGSPASGYTEADVEFRETGVAAAGSDLQFPRIAFESGTADLQPQSIEALKNLAERLNRLSMPASVEIQARVDSIGPEPFNFLLTKARVEVVRDVLIREGVDTHRLIARALGSQGDDSTKTGSQIQFVLRP